VVEDRMADVDRTEEEALELDRSDLKSPRK
jgi:hypothetical protein